MSKFCTKCGTELPNDARFCRGCGAKYEEFPQVDKAEENIMETKDKIDSSHSEETKKTSIKGESIKNINLTVVIIAGMVLVTVLIVVIILVFGMKSKKDDKSEMVDNRESSTIENEDLQTISEDDMQEIEDMTDEDTSTEIYDLEPEQDENAPDEVQVPDNPEQPDQPDQAEEVTIIDYDTAFKKFVADPYLNHIPFPGYGDFISIESKEQFGMAVLINVNEEYARAYANEETPTNGYTKNVFETSENGIYQYIADNGEGKTCQVIFKGDRMMILVGKSEAFDR